MIIICTILLAGKDSIESFEGAGENSGTSKRLFSEKTNM